jgi:hypothetical protein
MRTFFKVLALSIAQLIFIANAVRPQSASAEEPELIRRTVLPESIIGQAWGSVVDLGTLTTGKTYRIELDIQNPSGALMRFEKLGKSCTCYNATASFEAKASSLVLEPGGVIAVEMTARIPSKMGRDDGYLRVELNTAPGTLGNMYVRMNYKIAGLLEFLEQRVVRESRVNAGKEYFQVPLLLTAPVEAKNLYFHFPGELAGLTGDVILKDGKHFLQITVDTQTVKSRYISGEIGCVDTLTTREDSVYCVIKKSNGVNVHPATLRAVVPEDTSKGGYAIAMLVVVPSASNDKTGPGSVSDQRSDVLIDALFGDEPLELEVDRLSDSTFRAKVSLPEAVMSKIAKTSRPEIRWMVRTSQSNHEIISKVAIQDTGRPSL